VQGLLEGVKMTNKKWSEPKGKPKKIGKLGISDVYIDNRGHKFIYVKQYGKKRRIRDYTKF